MIYQTMVILLVVQVATESKVLYNPILSAAKIELKLTRYQYVFAPPNYLCTSGRKAKSKWSLCGSHTFKQKMNGHPFHRRHSTLEALHIKRK